MEFVIVIFFLNDKKLSSHMTQISENIYSSNQKDHYYDQIRKIIVNLGCKTVKKQRQLLTPTHPYTEFITNDYC